MTMTAPDRIYGKANGNGPYHLMVNTPSGAVAKCGSKRAHLSGNGYWVTIHRICPECERAERRELRAAALADAQAVQAEAEAALSRVVEAIGSVRQAQSVLRDRIERMQPISRSHPNKALRNNLMRGARDAGMTLQEIADLFGLTRQRVHQCLASNDGIDRPTV